MIESIGGDLGVADFNDNLAVIQIEGAYFAIPELDGVKISDVSRVEFTLQSFDESGSLLGTVYDIVEAGASGSFETDVIAQAASGETILRLLVTVFSRAGDVPLAKVAEVVEGPDIFADLPEPLLDSTTQISVSLQSEDGADELSLVMSSAEMSYEDAQISDDAADDEISFDNDSAYLMALGEGSRIEIHGADAAKDSSTTLAENVGSYTNLITVSEVTGWEAGDIVSIASPGNDWRDASQDSVYEIVEVLADGRSFALDRSIVLDSDDRAPTEVGLLSRNVKVHGDLEGVGDSDDAHTLILNGASQNISGVEFTRVGQFDDQGQYSVHWQVFEQGLANPSSSPNATTVITDDMARWSDATTWGGTLPDADSHVVIHEGMTVVLDQSVAVSSITVAGGALLVEDVKDLELVADWLFVMDSGLLQIGTEETPFVHDFALTLEGGDPAADIDIGAHIAGDVANSVHAVASTDVEVEEALAPAFAESALSEVMGTADDERLDGTDVDEMIDGQGGVDSVRGAGGADTFRMTDEGGTRDQVRIMDYDPVTDMIDLNGEVIKSVTMGSNGVNIRLDGADSDLIYVSGITEFSDLTFADGPKTPFFTGVALTTGTAGNDRLRGTDADETIEGLGGIDGARGGGGADDFSFFDQAGVLDQLRILDYQVGIDRVDLNGASVTSTTAGENGLYVRLNGGDRDAIYVAGVFDLDEINFSL